MEQSKRARKRKRIGIAESKVPEVTEKARARDEEIWKIHRMIGEVTRKLQQGRMNDVTFECKEIQRGGKGLLATTGPAEEGRWKIN